MSTLATPLWPAPTTLPGAVEQFLGVLAAEQQRYLTTLSGLAAPLAERPGDLAALAAGHARLVREFLDAQRALLRRRAETEAEADALLALSRATAFPPPVVEGRVDLPVPVGLAAAGGTQSSPAELAEMIDSAFDEPTAAAERELRALLDGWWVRECDEGKALLEDANARASATRRLGPPAPAPADPTPALPAALAGALDGPGSLDELLDTLLRVLDAGPEAGVTTGLVPGVRPGLVIADPVDNDERDAEHFERFWKGNSPANRGSVGNWLLVQLLLPMVSVVSVLALVLAVIG